MNRKNRKQIRKGSLLIAGVMALSGVTITEAAAQSRLNEHVAVEGRYLPEVTKAERLRSPLTPLEMKFGSDPAEGALTGEPVDFAPSLLALPPTVWRGGRPASPRGYIDLTLGSWLDGRLLAGYRAVDREDMELSVRLDALSSFLYKPENSLYRRRLIDGTLGVDFMKLYSGGMFNASVEYRCARFNYDLRKPTNISPDGMTEEHPRSPYQTVNEGALAVGWRSGREHSLRWRAGGGINIFGYSTLPFIDSDPTRETTIRLEGGVEGDAGLSSAEGNWGIGGKMALNMYGGEVRPSTNGLLSLTPGWHIFRSLESGRTDDFRWEARIGAKLDFSFNERSETERFGFLHVAPDASVSVGTSLFGAFFRATGGVEEQTLSAMNHRDLYAAPYMTGSLPAYTPADLRLGVSITPGGGFSATIEGGWKETRSLYAGGLWTIMLQHLSEMEEGLTAVPRSAYYNLHGFSVRAEIAWRAWKYLEVEAEVTRQLQRRATGWFNGYDRPEWTAEIGLKSTPVRKLTIEAQWNLRAKRSVTISDGLHYEDVIKLRNLSDLSLAVSYSFTPRFSIGVKGSNLLNRKVELMPNFVSEGIVATGGLQYLF